MKNGSKIQPILLAIWMITSVTALVIDESQPALKRADEISFKSQGDLFIPKLMQKYKVPGVAAALIAQGEIAWVENYGWKDLVQKKIVDDDTVFQVASNSKTLTAWGIMKLAETGKLDLDAPVEKYLTRWHLPNSKFGHDQVTLRRILSHTSGLSGRAYAGYDPEDRLPTLEESLSGKVNNGGKLEVVSRPGLKYRYSGGGYSLLQLVIEEVTGKAFSQYMAEEILDPLGMNNSAYGWRTDLQAKTARAYDMFGSSLPNYLYIEHAAAGLYTTARDLARFVAANFDNSGGEPAGRDIIQQSSLALLQTPVKKDYGLGYIIKKLPNGDRLIYHGGSNRGWRSQFALLPETGKGLVVLTNSENGENLHRDLVSFWTRWETGFTPYFHRSDIAGRLLVKSAALLMGLLLIINIWNTVNKLLRQRLFVALTDKRIARSNLPKLVLKVSVPLLAALLWWIFFYTGLFYNGWIFASFMPAGFLWLTAAVVAWGIFLSFQQLLKQLLESTA